MRFAYHFFTLALAVGTSSSALAGFIRFEGIAPAGGETTHNTATFTSDGFTFNQYHGHVISSTSATFGSWNGSDWLYNDSNRYLTFAKTNGNTFDLTSLDIGMYGSFSQNASRIITGFKTGGGTVQRTLIYGSGVTTMSFSSEWSDLTSVRFETHPLGNFVVTWFALDNIQYDGVSTVPEPGSLALWSWGIIGLGALAGRRRRE